jgi:peptidoglycan/LPS O-acetylase OafA/YrhL
MSTANYRPDIQGLRAIAVLAVMAFHFNPAWLPGGFVGVDVFLVISGFLITGILLHKKAQADYSLPATLKYFYSSRFKRIAPAYFVMLVLVALVAAVFFSCRKTSTPSRKAWKKRPGSTATTTLQALVITLLRPTMSNPYCTPGHWRWKYSSTYWLP